jgi:hypothetical protein
MLDRTISRGRIALIVGAVALAGGAAADPQPTASALRTECGKMGAAWIKQHPSPESEGMNASAARIFYGSKTKQCWLIKVELEGDVRVRHLIDAQTGIETMTCFDDSRHPETSHQPKRDCNYIDNVENVNLVSGFMAVPLPSKDPTQTVRRAP